MAENEGLLYHEYSNKTRYGLESVALRHTWAGYYLFVILSSFIGDTTILVASIKYQAIKLHRVIVVIIQHIAVCDLMLSTDAAVSFCSILTGKWVFGRLISHITNYGEFYLSTTSILLISIMTISKLLLIKHPLRFGQTSAKRAHILCGVCWAAALSIPALFLIVDRTDVYFSYRIYAPDYGYVSKTWLYLIALITVLAVIAPVCIVIVTSVNLLLIARKFAQKDRRSMKWQGIITTVLTSTVFCISFLPLCLFLVLDPFLSSEVKVQRSYTSLIRVAISFLSFNTISNFYIYCMTVPSFRSFVLSRLQLFSWLFTSSSIQGKTISP